MTPPFVIIVPARRAAARLPDKPLADIHGVPMIVRTLQQAAKAGATKLLAAVDDDEVAAVVKKAGFIAQMTGECDSGTARVAAAARAVNIGDRDIVVNVQGDEPLIEPDLIRDVATLLANRSDCVCATAIRPLHDEEEFYNTATVKVVANADNTARYFSRAPIPYPRDGDLPLVHIHIGIYAYSARFLRQLPQLSPSPAELTESLEQLRILWHGHNIALLLQDSQSFGVDTAADLERARAATADMAATADK